MKDVCFTQPKTQVIQPQIKGRTTAQGLILYQKIIILLLSLQSSAYRQQAGTQLVKLLQGSNTPNDQLLTALGSAACAQVRSILDMRDVQKIQSLTAVATAGSLSVTLQLAQGQSYTGVLA